MAVSFRALPVSLAKLLPATVFAAFVANGINFLKSAAENLTKAREDISTAIKASRKRGNGDVKAKVKTKGNKKRRITRKRYSVFDDEYD